MRAFSGCWQKVHIRVQLRDRPMLAFPLTVEQFRSIEERCFELTEAGASGELELPIPGGATISVAFGGITFLDFISGCPSDTECIEAVHVPEAEIATAC